MPKNAEMIRNLMFLTQLVQDHVVHFYHLHALDWVDIVSALKADPARPRGAGAENLPYWPTPRRRVFQATSQTTLKKFVESGQLGIFANAYWGHPAYKLPPEANLMAVAHYLEALNGRRKSSRSTPSSAARIRIPIILSAAWPPPSTAERQRHQHGTPEHDQGYDREANDFVEQMYIPDLLAIASFYPEWTQIGGGLGNYMVYGDIPQAGISDVGTSVSRAARS